MQGVRRKTCKTRHLRHWISRGHLGGHPLSVGIATEQRRTEGTCSPIYSFRATAGLHFALVRGLGCTTSLNDDESDGCFCDPGRSIDPWRFCCCHDSCSGAAERGLAPELCRGGKCRLERMGFELIQSTFWQASWKVVGTSQQRRLPRLRCYDDRRGLLLGRAHV